MSLSTHVFVLTYWGDDQVTNIFSSIDTAIEYAVQELVHYNQIQREEVVIELEANGIGVYADPESVLAVIIDPDESERLYTISKQEMNPTFKP